MMLERHRSKLNIKNNKSICNKIQSIHIRTMFFIWTTYIIQCFIIFKHHILSNLKCFILHIKCFIYIKVIKHNIFYYI